MDKIARDLVRCIIARHHYENKGTLGFLQYDSLYENYKDGHFDGEMTKKRFDIDFKSYNYKEDSFNETDLDRVILGFEKTLKRLKEARLSVD